MITILAVCGANGEVEDYGFAVTPLAVTLEDFETVGSQWGILPVISLTLPILVVATLLLIRRSRIARDRIYPCARLPGDHKGTLLLTLFANRKALLCQSCHLEHVSIINPGFYSARAKTTRSTSAV